MNVECFTGAGPDFQKLVVVEIHCPCCGRLIRLPAEQILNRVADQIEEYYRKENGYLHAENKRLRDIIQFGHEVRLIKEVAAKL